MQLRKHLWKQLRNQSPCRLCGLDHHTSFCLQRNGKKRPVLDYYSQFVKPFLTVTQAS